MIEPEQSPIAEPAPLARFEVLEEDGVRTVRALGEIDVSNVGELRWATTDLSNDALGIVLDVDQTDYIDSATVGLLYELRRRLARRGQLLSVVSRPGSNVHRVLELASFFGDDPSGPSSAVDAAAAIRAQLKLEP